MSYPQQQPQVIYQAQPQPQVIYQAQPQPQVIYQAQPQPIIIGPQPMMYAMPPPRTHTGLGTAALVMGILSIVFFWGFVILPFIFGLLAIILGAISWKNDSYGMVGCILGIIGLILGIVFWVIIAWIIVASYYTILPMFLA